MGDEKSSSSSVRIISGGNDRTQLFMGVLLIESRLGEMRGREKGRADLPGGSFSFQFGELKRGSQWEMRNHRRRPFVSFPEGMIGRSFSWAFC